MAYEHILTETHGAVALIRLNRPRVRNALCKALISELAGAVDGFESGTSIGALVITGDDQACGRRRVAEVVRRASRPAEVLRDSTA
jgi:enoyl-CoA hydratase